VDTREREGDFTDNFNELSKIYLHLIQSPFNMIKGLKE
jgi:hypothetical protein